MKKFLALVLTLTMVFSLAACTKTAAPAEAPSEASTEASAELDPIYMAVVGFAGIDEDSVNALIKGYWEAVGITKFDDGTYPEQWKYKFYDSVDSALLALDRGDVYSYSCPDACVSYIMAKNPGKYREDPQGGSGNSDFIMSMALLKDNTELLNKLNTAIDELKADGTLDALKKEYLTSTDDPKPVTVPTIEGAETVKFYVTGDLAPYDYVTVDGTPAGFNVALVAAIAEKLGVNVEFVCGESPSRYIALTSGKADVVFYARGWDTADGSGAYLDCPDGIAVSNPYTTMNSCGIILADK